MQGRSMLRPYDSVPSATSGEQGERKVKAFPLQTAKGEKNRRGSSLLFYSTYNPSSGVFAENGKSPNRWR